MFLQLLLDLRGLFGNSPVIAKQTSKIAESVLFTGKILWLIPNQPILSKHRK